MDNDYPRLFELGSSWNCLMEDELKLPYIASLAAFVSRERSSGIPIYPPEELVFNALLNTPVEKAKVIIVGQDPYHGPGQAHGLSFSVPHHIPAPPSLQNIFKELAADIGISIPSHGCLNHWAEQGVLLLNATLTVRQSEPMSHHGKGWERFTDALIDKLSERPEPLIFVLWGKSAQEKCQRLQLSSKLAKHLILKAPHPSPFSAHQGFFGCRHFSKINEYLTKIGKTQIDWSI